MKLTGKRGGQARRWRFHKAQCRKEISLRMGTFFQGNQLDFRTAILFVYCWTYGYTTTAFCSTELGMKRKSAVHWNKQMREVAAESALRVPLVIGGPGLTVEVDETIYSKRKYQRGRTYPQQWVFRGVCRETGDCFLVPVGGRSKPDTDTADKAVCQALLYGHNRLLGRVPQSGGEWLHSFDS
uniref:ISXO2-like transposase domain-containing protein n=1 Tax=Trichuris muris TaxID=70415 RepID=A0A5S6QMU3_TRIMR